MAPFHPLIHLVHSADGNAAAQAFRFLGVPPAVRHARYLQYSLYLVLIRSTILHLLLVHLTFAGFYRHRRIRLSHGKSVVIRRYQP